MKFKPIIGIDIGRYSIKSIVLSKNDNNYKIEAASEFMLPYEYINRDNLFDIKKSSQLIKLSLKNIPDIYKSAGISVSGKDVITKIVQASSFLNEYELEMFIEMEVENIISFPLDEVFFDFEIIGANKEDPTALNDILLSIAKKENVLSSVMSLESAGLKVHFVDIARYAIARGSQFISPIEEMQKCIAILDIGASHMSLNILDHSNILFYQSKNYGGEACTNSIMKKYQISFQDAEICKINGELPRKPQFESLDIYMDILKPFINLIVSDLKKDLRLFSRNYVNLGVEKLFLIGGTSKMATLLQVLQTEFTMQVLIADPFENFDFNDPNSQTKVKSSGMLYIKALGLALRGGIDV